MYFFPALLYDTPLLPPPQLRQEGVNTIWVEVVNDDPSFLLEQHRTAAQTMPDYSERASDWEAVRGRIHTV